MHAAPDQTLDWLSPMRYNWPSCHGQWSPSVCVWLCAVPAVLCAVPAVSRALPAVSCALPAVCSARPAQPLLCPPYAVPAVSCALPAVCCACRVSCSARRVVCFARRVLCPPCSAPALPAASCAVPAVLCALPALLSPCSARRLVCCARPTQPLLSQVRREGGHLPAGGSPLRSLLAARCQPRRQLQRVARPSPWRRDGHLPPPQVGPSPELTDDRTSVIPHDPDPCFRYPLHVPQMLCFLYPIWPLHAFHNPTSVTRYSPYYYFLTLLPDVPCGDSHPLPIHRLYSVLTVPRTSPPSNKLIALHSRNCPSSLDPRHLCPTVMSGSMYDESRLHAVNYLVTFNGGGGGGGGGEEASYKRGLTKTIKSNVFIL